MFNPSIHPQTFPSPCFPDAFVPQPRLSFISYRPLLLFFHPLTSIYSSSDSISSSYFLFRLTFCNSELSPVCIVIITRSLSGDSSGTQPCNSFACSCLHIAETPFFPLSRAGLPTWFRLLLLFMLFPILVYSKFSLFHPLPV